MTHALLMFSTLPAQATGEPVFVHEPPLTRTVFPGASVGIGFTVDDPESDPVSVSDNGTLPQGLMLTNNGGGSWSITGMVNGADASDYAVELTASDPGSNSSVFHLILTVAPQALDQLAEQAYIKASNTDDSDHFGLSMSIDGDTLVIGTRSEDSSATGVNADQSDNSAASSGAVYVFVRDGAGAWTQQAYLKSSNAETNDRFGHSVSVDGNTIVVGAYTEDSNATGINGIQSDNSAAGSGAAYVFVRDGGGVWTQQTYLKASNTGDGDNFGYSVSVDGDTIVVGARQEGSSATGINGDQSDNSATNSGAAYVFERIGGGIWLQKAYLKSSNTEANDRFGRSVSLHGDTIVVGATGEDSSATGINGNQSDNSITGSGAAYVFAREGGLWTQQAYLKASNTDAFDGFSFSVSVDGDTIVVGADQEDSSALGVNGNQSDDSSAESGAAYVFVRDGAGAWTQQAYLKASNTETDDLFGSSVSVDGDAIVVGAYQEDSGASGVNGIQSDNSATDSGAAYVFVRDGAGAWIQQAYLKASNTEVDDLFGSTVSVDGETIAVGAYQEDSNATGINGNQLDNSATDSGVAYAFAVPPIAPAFVQAPPNERTVFPGVSIGIEFAVLDPQGDLVTVSDNSTLPPGLMLTDNGGGNWSITGMVSESYGADYAVELTASDSGGNSSLFSLTISVAPQNLDQLSQQAYLKASNTDADDRFGYSVSIDGDTIVVGAYQEASNATGVNGTQLDNSVATSGAVYVFVRDEGVWTQQAYLKASNTDFGDNFGWSVCIDGETIVVGAHTEDSNVTGVDGNQLDNSALSSGAAYVFARDGGLWTQQAYLKASNTDSGDRFGYSVSVDGGTIVVGARQEGSSATGINGDQSDNSAANSGAVYVYAHDGAGAWTQQAYLKASNTETNDMFGSSVSVNGDAIVVGAHLENSNATGINGDQSNNSAGSSGAAYVFVRDGGGVWIQQAYLKASNADSGDIFGSSVSVDGDTIVVGAHLEDSNATGVNGNQSPDSAADSGAVYVFVRDGAGAWTQQAYLKASNTDSEDRFGNSVSVNGDTIVVGAYHENSSATGVNGDQSDNSAANSGAVYVFARDGADAWTQQAYLKASNTDSEDRFGYSVSVDSDTIVVGAYQEGSSATGVNGDQSDNSAPGDDSGAAYAFSPPRLSEIRAYVGESTNAPEVFDAQTAAIFLGGVVLGVPSTRSFTIENPGPGDLDVTQITSPSGTTVLNAPTSPIGPGFSHTFQVRVDAAALGNIDGDLLIVTNAHHATPFTFPVSATVVLDTDSDGDGMKDLAELNMAALGFNYEIAQPELVATFDQHASQHGLYTVSQLQGILLDAPIIERDPGTGRFTLTIGVKKSLDLSPGSFFDFSFVEEDTFLNAGKIEFHFDSSEPAAFFFLSGEE